MSTIREKLAINYNPKPRVNRQRKISPAQRQEIQYRKSEGASNQELALEYGIGAGYIRDSFPPMERPLEF